MRQSILSRSPGLSATILLIAGLAAVLCSCSTAYVPVAGQDYIAPEGGADSLAAIKGSQLNEGGFFGMHTGFVQMIDGLFVHAAADYWAQPLSLTPGEHNIIVGYAYSNFLSRTSFRFTAQAGVTYQIAIKNGKDAASDRLYCDFWLADTATGSPVSPVKHCLVSGGKPSSIFSAR